ncbi:hypothetical protein AAVH_32250 [Aphelenchoides avenae]|nr:hypothetical protein AAVH_32250 [Aphelenchus avenae]
MASTKMLSVCLFLVVMSVVVEQGNAWYGYGYPYYGYYGYYGKRNSGFQQSQPQVPYAQYYGNQPLPQWGGERSSAQGQQQHNDGGNHE